MTGNPKPCLTRNHSWFIILIKVAMNLWLECSLPWTDTNLTLELVTWRTVKSTSCVLRGFVHRRVNDTDSVEMILIPARICAYESYLHGIKPGNTDASVPKWLILVLIKFSELYSSKWHLKPSYVVCSWKFHHHLWNLLIIVDQSIVCVEFRNIQFKVFMPLSSMSHFCETKTK